MEEPSENVELKKSEDVPPTEAPPPEKPIRTYAQMKQELKNKGSAAMGGEEGRIYFQGLREEKEAQKQREQAAEKRYWSFTKAIAGNILVKALWYGVYGLWTLTPIAGIVIGIIYASSDNCPANPSIAPLLIVLGLLSTLVGVSLASQKGKQGQGEEGQEPPAASSQSGAMVIGQALGVCAGGCIGCLVIILKVVHVILFITTCVIVYGLTGEVHLSKVDQPDGEVDPLYCNEILYRFAFWSVTLSLFILCFLVTMCYCVCATFIGYMELSSREPKEPENV